MHVGLRLYLAMAALSGVVSSTAVGQTASTMPTAAIAVPGVAAKAAIPRRCMRLPLSDIAVGRPETVALAQLRLGEYAVKEAKRRGWSGPFAKSDEVINCEDYLYLPLVGQEYKCFVTATFCVK